MASEQGPGPRHTTLIVAVAVAAAVAVIVALAVTLGGDGDDDPDDPGFATDPATQAPPACPEAPGEGESDPVDELDPDAPDTVPTGATSVRLCQGVGTELPDAGALLTDGADGADEVVAATNGLEQRAEEPDLCTMDMGPGYRMVFGYADGSTFTVSGKTYGCRTLVVGSHYRIPATEPLELFRELSQ